MWRQPHRYPMKTRYRNIKLLPAGFFALIVFIIDIGQLAPKQISIIASNTLMAVILIENPSTRGMV